MAYERVNWLNSGEQGAKPINKTNLNIMDKGIADLDVNKLDKTIMFDGDLNNVVTDCNIYAGGDATNTPILGGSFYITVKKYPKGVGFVLQEAIWVEGNIDITRIYQRQCFNGTWSKWKLINASQITTGEESATNEYIDGKQVFRKRIDFGALSSGTMVQKEIGYAINLINLIRITGAGYSSYNGRQECIPSPYINVGLNSNKVYVHNTLSYDLETWSYVDVYYTKN